MGADTCTELKKLVLSLAGGTNDQQQRARKAVKRMGEEDCTKELREVADELAGGTNMQVEIADLAIEEM